MKDETLLYFDSSFNPITKLSTICLILESNGTRQIILKDFTVPKTSNEAEYLGLLEALLYAQKESTIYTDSQLLVGHLTKNWNVNAENLKDYYKMAKDRLEGLKCSLKWIPREKNKAGVILEMINKLYHTLPEFNEFGVNPELPKFERDEEDFR